MTPLFLFKNNLVKVLFATLYNYAGLEFFSSESLADIGNLGIINRNTALLDVAASLGLGSAETESHEKTHNIHSAVNKFAFFKLSGGHVLIAASTGEKRFCGSFSLLCLIFIPTK